jgi:uncharacterized membrane protein (DUF485 family)
MKIENNWNVCVNAAQNCVVLICNFIFMLVIHLIFMLVIGCNQMYLRTLLVCATNGIFCLIFD